MATKNPNCKECGQAIVERKQTNMKLGKITHKHNQCGDLELEKFFDMICVRIGDKFCWLDDEGREKLQSLIKKFEDNYE